jgi:DNA-binding IclR family transcriptional regulator
MSETHASENERRTVRAVEISCEIIDTLRERNGAGVTEIANELDVTKGAVYTHLATLEENELVVKENNEYRLSLRFLGLGEHVRNQMQIRDVVEKEIEKLAEESGEVAQFMVKEHGRGVYLHKAEGENAVQTSSFVGDQNPLHSTALGKAILAFLPEERVDQIVDQHGLPAKTPNTITDRDELDEELEQTREEGLAFDHEEIFKGLQCVAAPVIDQQGELIGAVSVTGPTSRMQGSRLKEEIAEMVQHASNVIEVNAAQVR